MATDHHHSGFDQDQFDRYDTFDAPVEDNVDTNREGLGGEIGRLIDQIRINHAASKLEKDVSVGEDRALNATGNWAAVPHEQLYSSVHTNNDPTEAYSLAREWTDLGNMMAENSRAMDAAIRSTESGWQGAAAEVAREATLKLATWGGDAAQTSQYMGTRIADQGLAAERAKSAMPEPVQFDYEQMLRQGFATGGLAGLAMAAQDVQVASAQARSAHEQAVRVMSEMETRSRDVDETTPRFVRPPEVADGGTAQMSLMRGDSDGLAASARSAATGTLPSGQSAAMLPAGFESGSALAANAGGGASGAGGGTGAAAFGGGVPAGGAAAFAGGGGPGGFSGGGGFPGGVPGGVPGGSSAQRNAQAYVPPHIQAPEVPDFGTSAAGFTSGNPAGTGGHLSGNSFQGNGFQPGGTGFGGGFVPGGLPGGSNRDSNSGYVPPKVPGGINPVTGQPYTPGDVRRGIPSFGVPGGGGPGGGVPGGGGAGGGGVPGGGAGAGTAGAGGYGQRGGAGMPGMGGAGSSVGAFAAEQAAARNAASAAGAARAGSPGAPGMGAPGGMGGGGSRGEDDKEHRNKYATNEKVVEEPGRMVPQVIGEKSAKQLREEQPE